MPDSTAIGVSVPIEPDRIVGVDGHRFEEARDVFLRVAERLLRFEQRRRLHVLVLRQQSEFRLDDLQVFQLVLRPVEPFGIGLGGGQLGLELGILDDPAFFQIDQQHLARLEPPFAGDVLIVERQHAAFRRRGR